jgi:hypothetical protein
MALLSFKESRPGAYGRKASNAALPISTSIGTSPDPIFFDRSQEGRLNAPDGSYGVLYIARGAEGAFAETFLRRPGLTLIDDGLLHRKAYVRLKVTSRLKLIKFAGPRPGDTRCDG